MTSIQIPIYQHIDQIKELNSKYLITNLTEAEKQSGFIRIEYDKDSLKKIIDDQEIVVATNHDKIIGYYLIGRKSGFAALDYQKNKAISLFDTKNIPFDKIGFGCQVCIDKAHRNNGLFKSMLDTLCNAIKEKYSHLLCSVSDDNIVSLKTHTKNGWQSFDTIDKTHFFIYPTNN